MSRILFGLVIIVAPFAFAFLERALDPQPSPDQSWSALPFYISVLTVPIGLALILGGIVALWRGRRRIT